MAGAREMRDKVAVVIGAALANEFTDDQLPAILHAIDTDEHEVRICAQRAGRPGVDNPPAFMLYLLRERKHAGAIPIKDPQPYGVPARSSDEEMEIQRVRMRQWKRIQAGVARSRELSDLYDILTRTNPDAPQYVRDEMLAAMDEMNEEAERGRTAPQV